MDQDVSVLTDELPDAELVFAFVSPLGSPASDIQEALATALRDHGYEIEVTIQISSLLDQMASPPGDERPAQRQERLMTAGNTLRREHGGDYLALMAIATINASRTTDVKPYKRRAHVVRSLKHPDEVSRLRHVYGKGFFLLGVSAPRQLRRKTLVLDLTEFGRAVHAEMAALMSCLRSGVTPIRGTLYCTTFPCHNCAKHIVAAGIETVIYIEPDPKSKARDLHADAITLPDDDEREPLMQRVHFRPFEGIGPRRFVDLFSMTLGSGRPLRRKAKDADGARRPWQRGQDSRPRLALDPRSYLEREDDAAKTFRQKQEKAARLPTENIHGPAIDPSAPNSHTEGSS